MTPIESELSKIFESTKLKLLVRVHIGKHALEIVLTRGNESSTCVGPTS
jgi:hypothetical protein